MYFRNLIAAIFGRTQPQAAAPAAPAFDIRSALVAALHNPKYEFRTIGALVKAAGGADRATVESLLRELGARQAYRKPELWGRGRCRWQRSAQRIL